MAAGLFGLAAVALAVMTLHRAPSASESLVVLAAAWGASLILLMIAAAAKASRAVVLAHVTTLAVLPCVAAVLYRGVSWEPLVRTTVVAGVVCGVTGVAAAAMRNVREWLRPVAEGAGIVVALCAAAFALRGVGCDAVEAAAVLGALVVLGLGAVAWAAVPSSGLAGLARSVAAGTPVDGFAVGKQVAGARRSMAAWFVALAVVACACIWVLMGSSLASAAVLAAVLALIVLVRAREFRYPGHVLALVVPVVLTVVVAVPAGHLWGWSRFEATVAVVVTLIVGAGIFSVVGFNDIWRSRLRLAVGKAETLLLVSVLPLVLGVFDVYRSVYRALR